jgi:ABC-type multidrug transport system ATPase subunit
VLTLCHVGKSFGAGQNVLSDIDFSFGDCGFYVLTGANGSGKSTLLNIMAGLDLQHSGTLTFDGTIIDRKTADGYSSSIIALLSQEPLIFDDWTVEKNIRNVVAASKKEVESELRLVDLDPSRMLKQRASSLSKGEKQRLAIARALLKKPKILLVDEVTSNLDAGNAKSIIALLERLSKTLLVVFATHETQRIENADCVFISLENGTIRSSGGQLQPSSLPSQSRKGVNGLGKTALFWSQTAKRLKQNRLLFLAVALSTALAWAVAMPFEIYRDAYESRQATDSGIVDTPYVQRVKAAAEIENCAAVAVFSPDASYGGNVLEDVPDEDVFPSASVACYFLSTGFRAVKTFPGHFGGIAESELLYGTRFPSSSDELLLPSETFSELAAAISKERGVSLASAMTILLDGTQSSQFLGDYRIVGVFRSRPIMSETLYEAAREQEADRFVYPGSLFYRVGFVIQDGVAVDKSQASIVLTSGNEAILLAHYKQIDCGLRIPEKGSPTNDRHSTLTDFSNESYYCTLSFLAYFLSLLLGLGLFASYWAANKRGIAMERTLGLSREGAIYGTTGFFGLAFALGLLLGELGGAIGIGMAESAVSSHFYFQMSEMFPSFFFGFIIAALLALILALAAEALARVLNKKDMSKLLARLRREQ